MRIVKTPFKDLFVVENILFEDKRGAFFKLYNSEFFLENNLDVDFKEFYFSKSKKNVIRGMHFQVPPSDHTKLVSVSNGSVIDVVVDLRQKSETFKKYFHIHLSGNNNKALYIPKGFAHGFLSLEDNTIVNYLQTSCYNDNCDSGIRYDSFGFDWGISYPILSDRDLSLDSLNDLKPIF